MSDSITKIRKTLYEEIWAEPMTTVALRYGISDNGLRKRCKALNIPWPPNGYWAKVKAGKPVPERPALPPYDETVLNYIDYGDESSSPKVQAKRKKGVLELLDLQDLTIEQLANMHDFDVLAPGSLEIFSDWCNGLTIPGRVSDYHELITRHKLEMEYRESRDKEYPFREEGIRIWKGYEKVKERDNEAVIPINVSNHQLGRAYRIVDTILKAFLQLKGNVSIERGKTDNIQLKLLGTPVSFEINECKTKRRHHNNMKASQEFRPLYEETFDGRLNISWKLGDVQSNFVDAENNHLENQISTMIFEAYKYCCEIEIYYNLDYKKRMLEYERYEEEKLEKEILEKQQRSERKRQARMSSLINDIPAHAENWFKHEKLSQFADELESRLTTCGEEEVRLLKEYIQLVRENANKCNPLGHILQEMRTIELQDDN